MGKFLSFSLLLLSSLFFTYDSAAQSCIPTGLNGSVVNLSCSQTCTDFRFQLPHLKSTSNYVVNTVPYAPFPYIVPGGQEDLNLYDDDTYSTTIPLPFPFCFFDSTYNKAVVGSNGVVTFDTLNAGCANAYTIANTIPYAGGTRCSGISPDYYPKASIMGFFSDIDPTDIEGPPDRKIQWHVEGVAPCRKFVVSYYHVGTFGTLCGLSVDSSNTFQMVMYESTGLVDVYIQNKSCFSSTNSPGYAILGIQNWNQNQAVAAPGKNKTIWTSQNEGYRFTPNGGTSRFVSSGLYTMAGALIANADTSTTTAGLLDISFPNICPGATTQYVIRTTFNSCPAGTQMISYDTITIAHINTLTAEAVSTPSTCGASVGTITATVTGGTGTPPFTYTLTPGGATNNTGIFPGLAAGNYTINIQDVNSCPVTITETVDALSSLAGTSVSTGTACTGVNNGTITLTPQGNPPYSFTLTGPGGPYVQSSPIFTNLNSGTYNATYTDGSNCAGTISNIQVASGGTLGGSQTHTNTTCAGASDGTITVTPNVSGSYTFVLNPGAIATNTTGIFNSLPTGTYSVTFSNNSTGCSGTVTGITISQGSTIPATWIRTNETCPGRNDGTIQITPSAAGSYTYTLTPGGVTNTTGLFINLSPGIFYNVTFNNLTSGCGGAMTNLFVQAASATLTGTANTVDATCPGVNDGSISVTVTPPGTYTYTLSPGGISNSTGIFSNLAPNTYSVTIANAGGCGTTLNNIIVSSGTGSTTTSTTVAASCVGVSNGSISVVPPASGGPFIYTLNPGNVVQNNNPVFNGLAAGNYTITYSTGAGCGGTVVPAPVVTAGAAPTATAAAVNATCPGVDNGTITVTPPAAGGPFVYTLNPGNIVQNNNPVFTGLATGAYTISFTNAAGCLGTVTGNTTIGAGSNPTTTAIATAATCPGVNDGTVTVNAPASGGPFTYTLNPGAITNSTGIFTGLAMGSYTITFTTAAGCTGTVPVNPVVAAGSSPTTTAIATATSCATVNDGTITVNPPASGGPFTYTLNPGAVTNSTGIFTGLSPQTYTITFTTSAGCSGTVPVNPVVTAGGTPTTPATTTNTTCAAVNDGVITITPPAAGGPFTYTLNPGNIVQNNNPVFSGLPAGAYTISFSSAAGCVGNVTGNLNIAVGTAPVATAVPTRTTCPGVNDGIITVTPPAAGGPFIYTLNPGNIVQNNNPVFSGLTPDVYTITFTTVLGCAGTVNGTINLQAGPPLTGTVTKVNPPCANINDGSITIVPSLAGVYTYVLNPGLPGEQTQVNDPLFTNLPPGNYTYSFTNASGCIGTGSATLTTNSPLRSTATVTMPLCNGNADGIISVTASGGVAPYQYAINPFSSFQNGSFNSLAAGTYTFRIRDNVGCTKDTTITLAEPSVLTASATSTQGTCNGNDGTITVTANGGTPAYEYSIDAGTSFQSSSNFIVSGGNYPDLRVRDSKGCIANTAVNVTLIDDMSALYIGNDTTICFGQSVRFEPQVSTQASVFDWSTIPNPAVVVSLDDSTIRNATATPPDTITYVLNAQWGVCSRVDTITVNVLHKPIPYAGKDTAVCLDKTIAYLNGSATNLSGTVNFEWSDTTNLQTPHGPSTVATPPVTETFILTVTDNYGCDFSVSDSVTVTVQPPVPAFAGNDTIAVLNQPHQLMASGGVAYEWQPAAPLNFASIGNPLATLDHDQMFTVIVTDEAGCVGSDNVFVQVFAGPTYYVPNAFSPNGDGLNDIFRVTPPGISNTEYFRIFNRYGQLVFETNKWLKGWDGTFLGKKQPMGNYVWIIKGTDKFGKVVEMKGTVLLIQ